MVFPDTALVQPGPDASKLTHFITLPHASHTGLGFFLLRYKIFHFVSDALEPGGGLCKLSVVISSNVLKEFCFSLCGDLPWLFHTVHIDP